MIRREQRGKLPRGLGADGEDGGLHLDPGGNAEDREIAPHRIEDIARRAVAAGEEDQRHAALPERHGRAARVLGRGLRRGLARDHLDIEAGGLCSIGAQDARRRQDRDRPGIAGKPCQSAPGAGRRQGLGAQLARTCEGGGAVGPLEGGAAAHAGDGIDDETDLARGRGHGSLGMLRQAGIQPNDAGHRGQPLSALPGCS